MPASRQCRALKQPSGCWLPACRLGFPMRTGPLDVLPPIFATSDLYTLHKYRRCQARCHNGTMPAQSSIGHEPGADLRKIRLRALEACVCKD